MRRTARRLTAIAATILLSTTAVAVVAETPALAAGCSVPSNRPNGGGGFNIVKPATIWTGPYSTCGVIGHADTQQILWAWCFYVNSYNNGWYYVRVGGTSTYGWIYDNSGEVTYFDTTTPAGFPDPVKKCS
jgi:hypothetical protein